MATAERRIPTPHDLLDALLDIKRLAEKSGDHETEPFALLDLIAERPRSVLNYAHR